jgi:SAM-dependent methyltransferase
MTEEAKIRERDFSGIAFDREDERDDAEFYSVERLVSHLDDQALGVVTEIIGSLVVEDRPEILDLMASCDSHLPVGLDPANVVGLGMNGVELDANPVLDSWVVHDLNREPALPFADGAFDVVLNTVSVDYLTRPFAVFGEVARVLRPGGLFLVLFSNRFFSEKVIRIWREAGDEQRLQLVEEYFASCPDLGPASHCSVHGRPRPEHDRYAHTGLPSDPVTAVWAEKQGGEWDRPERPIPDLEPWFIRDPEELERRKAAVGASLECPYCGDRLQKWAVPQTPFTEWDEEFHFICFNDRCPYLLRGWRAMERQGNRGFSYRLMFSPGRNRCMSVPVPSLNALREGIVDD